MSLGTGEVSKSLTMKHKSMHSTPVADKVEALMSSSMVAVTYPEKEINDSWGWKICEKECRSLSRMIVRGWTWAVGGLKYPE
jgi:hypothetical protein